MRIKPPYQAFRRAVLALWFAVALFLAVTIFGSVVSSLFFGDGPLPKETEGPRASAAEPTAAQAPQAMRP